MKEKEKERKVVRNRGERKGGERRELKTTDEKRGKDRGECEGIDQLMQPTPLIQTLQRKHFVDSLY